MLDVFLHKHRIGRLEARGRGIRFTYSAESLDDPRVPALSIALPKQSKPFADSAAGPFFRNLLPEQAYRRLVAAAAATTPGDSTALLGVIGAESPGAVSIWPETRDLDTSPKYERISADDLRTLFSRRNPAQLAAATVRGRLSLPGVQEKIALMRRDDAWLLPINGAITSHILKEATPAFPGLLENELFCMALAANAGLTVSATGLAAPSVRVFCTERFDRAPIGAAGSLHYQKIHQEDFCQALRVEPERKYEIDGGPGLRACARHIRKQAAFPARELERLTRWTTFNSLIGNEDAHAKNLAWKYGDRGLELSPHYDLVSTEVYPDLARRMAMKIGGATDVRNVQRGDWNRFARDLQLPFDQIRTWMLDLANRISASLDRTTVDSESRYGKSSVYQEVGTIVRRRLEQMARQLG